MIAYLTLVFLTLFVFVGFMVLVCGLGLIFMAMIKMINGSEENDDN